MIDIYRPPQSDVADSPREKESAVRYGLLFLVALFGFPLFQFVAWVIVPIMNRIFADIGLQMGDFDRQTLILISDTVIMFILNSIFCVLGIKLSNANAWLFALILGLASGAAVMYEKDWHFISSAHEFPTWYELSSVFVGLVACVLVVLYLKRRDDDLLKFR